MQLPKGSIIGGFLRKKNHGTTTANSVYNCACVTVSQIHKLGIEKRRGPNEHPAGHQSNNVNSVPALEESNSMATSDLGLGDTTGNTPSIRAKPIVYKPSQNQLSTLCPDIFNCHSVEFT